MFLAQRLGGLQTMKLTMIFFALAAASTSAWAQADAIEKALGAAPAQLKDAATVIKWKPDFTYDTLKKGTNKLVCYDRSGLPGQAAYIVECTNLGNLERAAQNLKF